MNYLTLRPYVIGFFKRPKTDFIVVHCSATPPSKNATVEDIDQWHKARKFKAIGYHFVIYRDGSVHKGREYDTIGAHVEGINSKALGICMVGGVKEGNVEKAENNFTPAQFFSLTVLLSQLKTKYPQAKIKGHRDFDKGKECPSFDVAAWLAQNKIT